MKRQSLSPNLALQSFQWVLGLVILNLFGSVTQAQPSPPEARLKRTVTLGWEPIEGATLYEVEIRPVDPNSPEDSDEIPPISAKTKDPSWVSELTFGEYRMRLRSFDSRSVPGPWGALTSFVIKSLPPELVRPEEHEILRSTESETHSTIFQWKSSIGAAQYEIQVDDENGKEIHRELTQNTSIEVPLPVGRRYTWKVQSIMSNDEAGEKTQTARQFVIFGGPLASPQLTPIENGFVRKISWNEVPSAQSYSYTLQVLLNNNINGKRWKTLERKRGLKKTSIFFDKSYPEGSYRLKIKAVAPLRKSSPWRQIAFTAHADRSPAAEQQAVLKSVIDLQTTYYFFATYLLTQMNYRGEYPETGSTASFGSLGGTGRLGLAHFPYRGSWGYYGLVDLSGFLYNNTSVTFFASELHLIWKKFLGYANQLRISGGPYLKELPEVQGIEGGEAPLARISSAGVHFGIEYWWPFTQRLGMQLNGRIYQTTTKVSTPNNKDLLPSNSYQLGVMGTMKLGPTVNGLLGYAYRLDQAAYYSTTQGEASSSKAIASESQNRVKIDGHYINLRLEWGF